MKKALIWVLAIVAITFIFKPNGSANVNGYSVDFSSPAPSVNSEPAHEKLQPKPSTLLTSN